MIAPINNNSFMKTMLGVRANVSPISVVANKKSNSLTDIIDNLTETSFNNQDASNISSITAFSMVMPINPASLVSVQEYDSLTDNDDENSLDAEKDKTQQRNVKDDTKNEGELTEEEEAEVQDLKKTDEEVRRHEQAHALAGGAYASSPNYETVQGPDGKDYAVAGNVKIDTSPINGNPEATIKKMETIKRAALAPSEPSPEDKQVAMVAEQSKAQAEQELKAEEIKEQELFENSRDVNLFNLQEIAFMAYNKLMPSVISDNKVSYTSRNNSINLVA